MTNISGNDWAATIPASAVLPPGVEYYLSATDSVNVTLNASPATPYSIVVNSSPAITSVVPNSGLQPAAPLLLSFQNPFQKRQRRFCWDCGGSQVVVVMKPRLPARPASIHRRWM